MTSEPSAASRQGPAGRKIVYFHSQDELIWHREKSLDEVISSDEPYVYYHVELLRQLRVQHGWEVELCRMDEVYAEGGYRAAEARMIDRCRDADYALFLVQARPQFVQESTFRAIKAACPDTQIILHSHDEMKYQPIMTRAIARGADAILVSEHPLGAEALRRDLGNVAFFHYTSRQVFPPRDDRDDTEGYEYDVSFVGSAKANRERYCRLIARERPGLHTRFAVPTRPYYRSPDKLDLPQTLALTYASRINLVCNEKAPGLLHISSRFWQVLLCNSLALAEYTPDFEYLFDVEKELFVFRNDDELLEQIDFILDPANSAEVERRRRAGHDRTKRLVLEDLVGMIDEGRSGRAIVEALDHPAALRDAPLAHVPVTHARYKATRYFYLFHFLRRGEWRKVGPELHALKYGLPSRASKKEADRAERGQEAPERPTTLEL